MKEFRVSYSFSGKRKQEIIMATSIWEAQEMFHESNKGTYPTDVVIEG